LQDAHFAEGSRVRVPTTFMGDFRVSTARKVASMPERGYMSGLSWGRVQVSNG
jgi:hypothetical protein